MDHYQRPIEITTITLCQYFHEQQLATIATVFSKWIHPINSDRKRIKQIFTVEVERSRERKIKKSFGIFEPHLSIENRRQALIGAC